MRLSVSIRSATAFSCKYLSRSYPSVMVTVACSNTSESVRERTTETVFFLFRFMFCQAIAKGVTRCVFFADTGFRFFPVLKGCAERASAYFTASTGEIFASSLHGRIQLIQTVRKAKTALPAKTQGFGEIVKSFAKVVFFIMNGMSHTAIKYPAKSPAGIPTTHRRYACLRTMPASCLRVVPMVLSSP